MGVERRKFPRIPVTLAVAYRSPFLTEPHPSVTRDVGAGGIRIFTAMPLEQGTILKIDLQHPERQKLIHFTAEVMRSKPVNPPSREPGALPFEAALVFVSITDVDRALVLKSGTR